MVEPDEAIYLSFAITSVGGADACTRYASAASQNEPDVPPSVKDRRANGLDEAAADANPA